MKIKNIEFGRSDGKNESNLNNFENLFYNHNKIYEKLLKDEIFIVSGRRGTGKTTLVEYFIQKNKNLGHFCRKDSYESFRLNELINLKENQQVDYFSIWKWTILIELSKLIFLNKENLKTSEELEVLCKFLEENDFHMRLGGEKTISIIKENNLSGSLEVQAKSSVNIFNRLKAMISGKLKANKEDKNKTATEKGNYTNYLKSLENSVLNILNQNKNKTWYLIYDELDSFFSTGIDYKNIILNLIRSIESINNNFLKYKIKCKVIICLRTDILNILNYPNMTKLLSDSSLELSWNEQDGLSPLIFLIAKKIKVSNIEKFENKDEKKVDDILDIFYSIFEKKVIKINNKKMKIHNYILNKTLRRPRDIVHFFYCLHKNFGEAEKINEQMLFAVEKEYSSYFYQDIRSELSGHFESIEIDNCLEIIKKMERRTFTYEEIEKKIESLGINIEKNILNKLLEKLYEHGAIGNIEKINTGPNHTERPNWYYLNPSSFFKKDKTIVLHYGLYKILNLV